MILPKSLVFSLGSLLVAATARAEVASASVTDNAVAVPVSSTNRYIVKFSESGASRLARRDDGSVDTSTFYDELTDAGHDATPARSFDSELFRGVSFDLSGANNVSLASIQALPAVEKVWPAGYFTLPTGDAPVTVSIDTSSESPDSVTGAYNMTYTRWSAHNNTNVARVQADGYLGDDVVIGFVDTGIDYTHPALGGGFGPGYKVIGGYDLVGDSYVAGETDPVPDDDPMDCQGHGTHTAGTAASLDSLIPGVAPNAKLRAYKVFGCADGTYEDNIVAAFLRAYEDGVDIISASLGSDQGFPDTAMAEVATTISNKGVFVSIAAGNAGQSFGPFYTSSGGNGGGASVAVGSVQAQDWVGFAVHAESSSGASRDIVYLSSNLAQFDLDGKVDAYFPSGVRDLTACSWDLPAAPKGDVYIIPRGTCLSQVQDSTLFNLATYVFYVLNSSEYELVSRQVYSSSQPVGAATILDEDGDWLFSESEAGHTVTLTFKADHAALGIPRSVYNVGRISDFSSWGPTMDSRMKPEISAPGGSILSTWLTSSDSWAVYSGTSMATPYIAGVAALFFGSRGGRAALGENAAALARNRIVASGRPVYHNDGTDNLANVARQGAGLVDALKVIEYSTTLSPAVLQLNDTANFVGEHKVAVTNDGDDSVTFQIEHVAGPTAFSKGAGDAWVSTEPPYSSAAGDQATVVFSVDTLTLAAGETASFTVTFTEPADAGASYMPIHGGQIRLTGSNGEVVSAAYMGIKGSLYDSDMWEMERGTPLFLSGTSGLMVDGTNYTLADGSDVPQVYFNVLWSTSEISFDFVTKDWTPADWVYPPVAGSNNWVGSMRLVPNALTSSVVDFPYHDYPRYASGMYAKPQGILANGTKLAPGEYMILARTLRTFGDYNNLDDWQYKVSPWFRLIKEETVSSSSVVASSTSAVVSSSSIASSVVASPTPCPTVETIALTAYVGDNTVGHQFYRYSDFLAVDLGDSQSDLAKWQWIPTESDTFHLSTSVDGSSSIFASVHSNTNSLVYMYAASRINSPWSYLECSVSEDQTLSCVSGEKIYFYVCDSSSGLVRHGTTVLDGCTALTITVDVVQEAGCPSSSSAVASSTSTSAFVSVSQSASSVSASATSSLPACTGTVVPISLAARIESTDYPVYQYSDFLAVDTQGSQSPLSQWHYVDNAHLQVVNTNGATVYAGVHTNNNSLIYLYASSRLVAPYSFLDCVADSEGELVCSSDAKDTNYICETGQGILRSGPSVMDGCTSVTLVLTKQCVDEVVSSSSAAVSSTASSSVVSSSVSSVSASASVSASSSVSQSASASVSSSVASSSIQASASASLQSSIASSSSISASASSSEPVSSASASQSASRSISSAVSTSSSAASSSVASSAVSSVVPTSSSGSVSSSAVQSGFSSSAQASSSVVSPSASFAASSTAVSSGSSSIISSSISASQSGVASSVASSASGSEVASPSGSASASASAGQSSPTSVASPGVSSSVNSASSSPSDFTTSTVFSTSMATITACPSTVVDCPANSRTTYVTTVILAVSTTVCPVTAITATNTAHHTANRTSTLSLPYGSGQPFSGVDTTVRVSTKMATADVNIGVSGNTAATQTTHVAGTMTTTVAASGETTATISSGSGGSGGSNGSNSGSGSSSGSGSGSDSGANNGSPSSSSSSSTPATSGNVVTAGATSLFSNHLVTVAVTLLSFLCVV